MLKALIKKKTQKITPVIYGTVDSTNNIAKQMAHLGAAEGTTVIAKRQTAGRGRLGRTFVSKKGGVYMSVVLRPTLSPADTLFITAAAAVAAARAIEAVSHKKCQIKWVNDIYIDGKKVCGILTEGEISSHGSLAFAVLGVGINLFKPRDGISDKLPLASSVFDKNTPFFVKNRKKTQIIAVFADEFFKFYKNIKQKEFIKEYQNRSFLTNKQITYTKCGKTYKGIVTAVDDNANLVVATENGIQKLSQGDIQIIGMEQPNI